MPPKRNSAHWMVDFETLGEEIYKQKLNSKCIEFRKNSFTAVDNFCDARVDKIKNEMYPNHVNDSSLLDVHKIVSVYIQGFLKNPIYIKKGSAHGETVIDALANEYYCFIMLQVIINSWPNVKSANKKLQIPNDYRDCLLKLFYKYRKSTILKQDNTTFNYALASIMYFVERNFLYP
jgi:hypothetical protein